MTTKAKMIFFRVICILETHKKTSYIIKSSQNVSFETRNLIPLKLKSRCEDKNVANTLQSWMNEFERHIRRKPGLSNHCSKHFATYVFKESYPISI